MVRPSGSYALTFTRLYEVKDPAMHLLDRGLVGQTFATPSKAIIGQNQLEIARITG